MHSITQLPEFRLAVVVFNSVQLTYSISAHWFCETYVTRCSVQVFSKPVQKVMNILFNTFLFDNENWKMTNSLELKWFIHFSQTHFSQTQTQTHKFIFIIYYYYIFIIFLQFLVQFVKINLNNFVNAKAKIFNSIS